MFTTRKHHECAHCGATATACTIRPLTGERGRCCAGCRSAGHPEVTERTEVDAAEPLGDVTAAGVIAAPMSRATEDALVASILQRAADDPGGPELHGEATLDAYRTLAASRGLDLEVVVRAACRGELAAVVRRPAKSTTTT